MNGRWVGRKDSTLLERIALLYFSGHSPRHWLPSVSAALGVPKEKRDYVGRWHVNLHQSQDDVLTSRLRFRKLCADQFAKVLLVFVRRRCWRISVNIWVVKKCQMKR